MLSQITLESTEPMTVADGTQIRCFACGVVPTSLKPDLRCTECGNLLEIVYPGWGSEGHKQVPGLDAIALKDLWRSRRMSRLAADESGVWRFREMLPPLEADKIITLKEGNTPLYELP
jgi:threonine synthase